MEKNEAINKMMMCGWHLNMGERTLQNGGMVDRYCVREWRSGGSRRAYESVRATVVGANPHAMYGLWTSRRAREDIEYIRAR